MPLTSTEAFDLLNRAQRQDRLAHAYLITGPAGAGKRALARQLSARWLEDASSDPWQHPDAHLAEPESKSRRIVIEQIRELEHALRMRSLLGGRKVGVILDADRLQPAAANAFLKTLEEPPPHTHLLLVSAQPEQILETILSRCIEVPLRGPARQEFTPLQQALLEACASYARQDHADLPAIFALVRKFEALLAEARGGIQDQADADFKKEEQHYKQTTGSSKDWLEDREDHYKALIESRTQGVRGELLDVLEQWWGDALRQQHEVTHLDLPDYTETTAVLAARDSTARLLQRMEALRELRENLGRTGVNEMLALECGFLRAFGA